MPEISIGDGATLTPAAALFDTSVIGKTPETVLRFVRNDVVGLLDQPLDQVQVSNLSLGFNIHPPFTVPGGNLKMSGGGGLSGQFDLHRPMVPGRPQMLFDADRYGASVDTGPNCYLAFTLQLGVDATAKASPDAFALSLQGSGNASTTLFQPFAPQSEGFCSFKQAILDTCGSFILPATLEDAQRLKSGAGFVYEARGSLKFSGKVDVLAAVNPTATPGLCKAIGPLSLNAGPSLTVGGKFSLSGDIQVRIWRKSETVIQLGYYRKRGGSFALLFDASAGVDVEVGSFDVIAKLYSLLGDSGKLDPAWIKANIPQQVADQVEDAYESAVQTSFSASLEGELDASSTDQAAFVWNFDLTEVDAAARAAFALALQADISALLTDTLPAGVSKVGSVLDRLKDSKRALTLNFLGLLDHATVEEFASRCNVKASEDGQLVLTDTEHLTRLDATATPLVKADPLRKVFTEDCVATIGYAASLGPMAPQLKVTYSYYIFADRMSPSDLALYAVMAAQLGVPQASYDLAALRPGAEAGVPGSFLVKLVYDSMTAVRLFLDDHALPRSETDFQRVARMAAAKTPGLLANERFKALLGNDPAWAQICDAGSAQRFYQVIGVDTTNPDMAVSFYAVSQHIQHWASAMHAAASALAAVMNYLTTNQSAEVVKDPHFLSLRETFAVALQQAIQNTPLFQDAQGVITLYMAGQPASREVAIRCGSTLHEYA